MCSSDLNDSQKSKSCSKLLVLKKVAQNAKSCLKVAEHNLDMPTNDGGGSHLTSYSAPFLL